MLVVTDPASYLPPPVSVVTIGTYDGVHLGHRVILSRVRDLAKQHGGESVVLSFHPHPRQVVGSGGVQLLTTPEEKIRLLAAAGIDRLVLYPFTKRFSETTSADFIGHVVAATLQPSFVVVGYDHRFGHSRGGGLDELRDGGKQFGFQVEEIPAQQIDAAKVSSTRIRKALMDGDVTEANRLLGYPYSVTGTVVKGRQLGRTLGYPTANLSLPDLTKLVPSAGVYAVTCQLQDSRSLPGVLSIGTNPTVAAGLPLSIEAHLFDFNEDLYGQSLTVVFHRFLRQEEKFDSLEVLTQQMHRDAQAARAALRT